MNATSLKTGHVHSIEGGDILTAEGRFFRVEEISAAQAAARLEREASSPARADLTPAEQLRARLDAAGLAHKDAAKRLGVVPNTLGRWVRGEVPVPGWVDLALDGLLAKMVMQDKTS